MVTLLVDSETLEIVLSRSERALAFHRGNVLVSRVDVRRATLTDDPWVWLRGVASPGTYLPSVLAMGTWKWGGGVDFAVIRRKRPGVVIDLDRNAPYRRLIVSTVHGEQLLNALNVSGDQTSPETTEVTVIQGS